jgi:hypothetical protein
LIAPPKPTAFSPATTSPSIATATVHLPPNGMLIYRARSPIVQVALSVNPHEEVRQHIASESARERRKLEMCFAHLKRNLMSAVSALAWNAPWRRSPRISASYNDRDISHRKINVGWNVGRFDKNSYI